MRSSETSKRVWAVTSGCYSDYGVDCVFELEEDAKAYALRGNEEKAKRNHEAFIQGRYSFIQGRYSRLTTHTEPQEECPTCRKLVEDEDDGYGYHVESFDFWGPGELRLPGEPS